VTCPVMDDSIVRPGGPPSTMIGVTISIMPGILTPGIMGLVAKAPTRTMWMRVMRAKFVSIIPCDNSTEGSS
jgi:hypothetical protein